MHEFSRSDFMHEPDFTSRYRGPDGKIVIATVEDDEMLLRRFGVDAIGFEPGISIAVGSSSISLNTACWNWLRPLLKELYLRRRKDNFVDKSLEELNDRRKKDEGPRKA